MSAGVMKMVSYLLVIFPPLGSKVQAPGLNKEFRQ